MIVENVDTCVSKGIDVVPTLILKHIYGSVIDQVPDIELAGIPAYNTIKLIHSRLGAVLYR